MKLPDNISKVIFILIGLIVIALNVQLYIYCKEQRTELNAMKGKQDVESEFNTNKFKYQEELIDHVSKVLEDARRKIKEQKEALDDQKNDLADQKGSLLQEVEKRSQLENDSKGIQTSLVDIKAEADAIKQDMKGWQKDYVSVLAELEKKMDQSQEETKALENNLTSLNIPELKENINSLKADIENMTHPVDNSSTGTSPDTEKKVEHDNLGSQ